MVFALVLAKAATGIIWVTLHDALLYANAIGTAAANASATAAGRVVWGPDDRAAGYRAAGAVLDRLGWGHVVEPEGAWLR